MYKKLLTLSISLLIAASTTFAAGSQRIYKRKDLGKRSTQKLERQIANKIKQYQAGTSIRSFAAAYRPALLERFLKYVSYDRQSSETEPITADEIETAHKLYEEIKAMGLNVTLTKHYYIFVEIPSNIDRDVPVLGYSGHYDVTPGIEGSNIQARVIKSYDGEPIVLENSQVIDPNGANGAYLSQQVGKTIVTSDGNTLLGADDGAGLSVLITFMQTLADKPNLPHGKIQIVLAPNEDVARAAEYIEETPYAPDIAFDFDGGSDGRLAVENFTARQEIFTVKGVPGHQSYAATNGYRNAWTPACILGKTICPKEQMPNFSSGRQGYAELHHMYPAKKAKKEGGEEEIVYIAKLDVRLRGFDTTAMNEWEQNADAVAEQIAEEYGVKITRERTETYANIAESTHRNALQITLDAAKNVDVTVRPQAVRAGTTAALFSVKGIVGAFTIFTGQNNAHNYTEWLSEEDMYHSYLMALSLMNEVARFNYTSVK